VAHAFIQDRMDTWEKLEIYAEQAVAELSEFDDARSKFSVKAASIKVVGDAMAFFKTKRKRKRKWGGDRKSTKQVCCNGIRNKGCQGCNVDRGQYDE
jgi:hypothetical protein